jgi:hypothetical protein
MAHRNLTGRKRYRILTRWFRPPVLVLQVEVEGYITTFSGGHIDSIFDTWWVDCLPEWEMIQYEPEI